MGRDIRTLPDGWEAPIPDAIWPEAMISAVRHDASALASDRVISTIKTWQASAIAEDQRKQRDAKRYLRKLGDALSPEVEVDLEAFDQEVQTTALPEPEPPPKATQEAFTVDSIELPPPLKARRASRAETPKRNVDVESLEVEDKTAPPDPMPSHRIDSHETPSPIKADDAIVGEQPSDSGPFPSARSPHKVDTGSSMPPEGEFSEEDEFPTTALPYPDSSPKRDPSPLVDDRPTLQPPEFADGGPTRHIDLPDEVLAARVDSVLEGLGFDDDSNPSVSARPAIRRRSRSRPSKKDMGSARIALDESPEDFQASEAPSVLAEDLNELEATSSEGNLPPEPLTPMEPEDRSHSLKPKPGIIRRRSTKSRRRLHSSPRPRAAMHHVKALYGVITPLANELIPLPFERRSRRFWARWREVAGDRGVRREFIEDLLRSASDVRTLVCELIAEVQTVDVRSVYTLVDLMESEPSGQEAGTPDRQRGPMVGASIRVEGVNEED